MNNWKEKVYKIKKEIINTDWDIIRLVVISKAKRKCMRCDKKFNKNLLTAHHIIPRSLGGKDNIENLICLCNECHNFVEIHGYKLYSEIVGSYEQSFIKKQKQKEKIDTNDSIDWHLLVYGGHKRKGRKII